MAEVSLFIHVCGVTILLGTIIIVAILERLFWKADNSASAYSYHHTISSVGILTPIASGLLVITGIFNIVVLQYSILETRWLLLKIICVFFILVVGMIQGQAYKKRFKDVGALARGLAAGGEKEEIQMLTRRLRLLWKIQLGLILVALGLTMFRIYI